MNQITFDKPHKMNYPLDLKSKINTQKQERERAIKQ